jgi:hypothetical protein
MVGTTDISLYDRDKSGKSVVIKTGDIFVLFSYDSKIAEIKYNEEHLKYELLFFNTDNFVQTHTTFKHVINFLYLFNLSSKYNYRKLEKLWNSGERML